MSEHRPAQPPPQHPVTRKRLVVPILDADRVTVRKGVPLPSRTGVAIDLYQPPTRQSAQTAAVVLVSGLPDAGARRFLGCAINEMAAFSTWASAIAASGLTAVTYTTTDDPASDLQAVFTHLESEGPTLGIDGARCGLWACSSHVANALGLLLTRPDAIRCAVLLYGFMLDLDGSHAVADAQRTLAFANPARGRRVDELPRTPLLVARAGRDTFAAANTSIDGFVRHALAHNLPLTFVNHPTGPHAFDLDDDSPTTHLIVKQILAFLTAHLA
jgi:hypothetical protein